MPKKMLKKILLSVSLLALAPLAQAEVSVQSAAFEDQWEKPHSISAETNWLIFSSHKDGGKWVKESLTELSVTDLSQYKTVFVADISAMPGFITRMFAIPKLQDLPFKVYLDLEGTATQNWPRNSEQVSVYRLQQGEIMSTEYFSDEVALNTFLKGIIVTP
jgi:hypothetical protein